MIDPRTALTSSLLPICALALCLFFPAAGLRAQVSVGYTMQTGNFNSLQTEKNNNPPYGGTFNNGATELGNYANGGSFGNTPGAAAFETFTTTGNGNSGSVRALQVGDTFTITAFTSANPSAGGYIGISFRDSTTYANFFSATDNTAEARFQLDNTGGWKVYNAAAAVDSALGSNADRTFTIKVTSDNTFNATIGGTTYYDLGMAAGGGRIDSFAIYTYGDSNQNSFWKNASLSSTGTVELGYAAPGGSTRTFSTAITDGLAANSATTVSPNAVFVGGDAGSQVNLTASNSYTGSTTVNANARLEIQNASALGGTSSGTTVTSGGALSIYQATGGVTIAGEALTLSGVGVNGINGALRSTGGTNAWNGAVTLAANSRINADTSGSSGSMTLGGAIAGGANVLFLGAQGGSGGNTGGNITVNGAISGAGNTQDGTVTSLYKDGAGVLTLGSANTYTGDTRIAQGNLAVSGSGTLGSGSDVFIANGASLSLNSSATVASLREWGTTNGGTATIGTGATLTVSGNDWSGYMNSIGGSGNLVKSGTGTMNFYGSQTYGGTTTVSGGRLSTGVALASSGVTVSGGNFETTAANILGDTASVTVNSGSYNLGGDDTVGALSGTGGTINLGANRLTTTVASGSSSYTGGTIAGTGGGLTKAGSGTFSLGGTHTYSGGTAVGGGELRLVGAILSTSSSVSISSGAKLAGYGSTGALAGAGSVDPGNSPGIITTTQVDPSGGMDFNLEFTGLAPVFNAPAASVNDLVRITGTTPFSQSLGGANIINVYFSGDALYTSGATKQVKGGFFTDQQANFFNSISGATYNYYFAMSGGGTIYNGTEYVNRTTYETAKGFTLTITANTFSQTASFDGVNTINGQIVQFDVVPEPSTYALVALAGIAAGANVLRRRFRR